MSELAYFDHLHGENKTVASEIYIYIYIYIQNFSVDIEQFHPRIFFMDFAVHNYKLGDNETFGGYVQN